MTKILRIEDQPQMRKNIALILEMEKSMFSSPKMAVRDCFCLCTASQEFAVDPNGPTRHHEQMVSHSNTYFIQFFTGD